MKIFDWIKKKREPQQPTEQNPPSVTENTTVNTENNAITSQNETQQNDTQQKTETIPQEKQQQPKPKQQEHDAAIRLYSCRKNTDIIPSVFEKAFSEEYKKLDFVNNTEFVLTFKDDTFLKIRVITNKKETTAQAYGMANFFSKSPIKNQVLKENILQQMKLFNCIISIQFTLNSDEKRTNNIIKNIYSAAKALTAFVLVPTMEVFHYDGRLLIDTQGQSAFDTFHPIASADFLEKELKPTEADTQRKKKSIEILKSKKIPYLEELRSAVFDAETTLQTKEMIIKRLIATYATAIQAEIYLSGKYDNPEQKMKEQIALLEEKYHISNSFSAKEKEYIDHPPIKETKIFNSYAWRYECCAIFLWALSLLELKEPNQICEAVELGNVIWNHNFDSLSKAAKLRSKEEILALQDLTLRYNWACVDARINNKTIDALDFGIIYERHYALNWLLKVDGITDWDAVTTTT